MSNYDDLINYLQRRTGSDREAAAAFAILYLESRVAELEKDAARYRWICENGDRDDGLFIGRGRIGTYGECGHSEFLYKEAADAAIDEAMGEQ